MRILVISLLVSFHIFADCPDPKETLPKIYKSVRLHKDIHYCGDLNVTMDIRRPDSDKKFPLILFIHGGGWVGGDKDDYGGDIWEAAERGFVGATINYRLTKDGQNMHPTHINDVNCAIEFLKSHAEEYHIDTDRMGVTGASAGGHLALLTGLTRRDFKAIVNYYGPTDIQAFADEATKAKDFLKSVFPEKLFREASPVTYLTKTSSPILTLHGDKDDTVPYSQALKLEGFHTLLTCTGEDHDFSKKNRRRALEHMFSFMRRYLK